MNYCLKQKGLTKIDVGCPKDWQLEDFISSILDSKKTAQWIRLEGILKYGRWMLNFKPRVIAYVEEYVFNLLMKRLDCEMKFKDNLKFDDLCNLLENNKCPIPIHGNFPHLNGGGHICLAVGFIRDKETVIVHDPFGNVEYDKYKSHTKGEYAQYFVHKYFYKDKKNKYMWGQEVKNVT
jgi:hypothetical protein